MHDSKLNLTEQELQSYYAVPEFERRIRDGLVAAGVSLDSAGVDDLAAVDEFHIRGRQSTQELADRIELSPESRILDVGSGIGGTARYLSQRFDCHVTGIDLSGEYCDLARKLSQMVGLGERTQFVQGSALSLPFDDQTFDLVWTEHVQMNIADKQRFYSELARVLRPGGRFVFHDIFRASEGAIELPVPWAEKAEHSHLGREPEVIAMLETLGLEVEYRVDSTDAATQWMTAIRERVTQEGPPPLGVHMHLGPQGPTKITNLWRAFVEGRVMTSQAILRKA